MTDMLAVRAAWDCTAVDGVAGSGCEFDEATHSCGLTSSCQIRVMCPSVVHVCVCACVDCGVTRAGGHRRQPNVRCRVHLKGVRMSRTAGSAAPRTGRHAGHGSLACIDSLTRNGMPALVAAQSIPG